MFHPPLHGAVLAVGRRHASLGWVDVQGQAVIVAGEEPLSRLPAEGGRGVILGDQVNVLGLQRPQEADHPLGVLRGDGASQIGQGGDGPAGKDGGAGVDGGLPLAVPLESHLDFLVAGFQALESLGEDDGCPADAHRGVCLLVYGADAFF